MRPSSPYHVAPTSIPVTPLLREAMQSWSFQPKAWDPKAYGLDFLDGDQILVNEQKPIGVCRELGWWTADYENHRFQIVLNRGEAAPLPWLVVPLCGNCWEPLLRNNVGGRQRRTCSDGCRAALSDLLAKESR